MWKWWAHQGSNNTQIIIKNIGFLTLALTKQRTDQYQNISRWFPDYSLVQRGREPDDGGEQQVLRLSSQLGAVPNGDRRLHHHHHRHHHHH